MTGRMARRGMTGSADARAGLLVPRDLDTWAAWQRRRRRVRHAVGALRAATHREPDPVWHLTTWGEDPTVLVVLESRGASSAAALLRPVEALASTGVAVLSSVPVADLVATAPDHRAEVTPTTWQAQVAGVRAVLSAGHYLPLGAAVEEWASRRGVPRFVVQHGLVTPFAPPLPSGAHLLSWSAPDADFWCSGRTDVQTQVVGAQLLWEAADESARAPGGTTAPDVTPVYLGQLHGAELPRRGMARSAESFCRATGATYRPHPSETDVLSRLQHARWARQGMTIDTSGVPVSALGAPVVAAFSTGVIEAAARGLPSWVSYDRPPEWLEEFWERYSMARWGGPPTPAPDRPALEPAIAVAAILSEAARG